MKIKLAISSFVISIVLLLLLGDLTVPRGDALDVLARPLGITIYFAFGALILNSIGAFVTNDQPFQNNFACNLGFIISFIIYTLIQPIILYQNSYIGGAEGAAFFLILMYLAFGVFLLVVVYGAGLLAFLTSRTIKRKFDS